MSRLMWWQQEMNLEEDDDGRFYDKAGNEVGADQVQRGGVFYPPPCPTPGPRRTSPGELTWTDNQRRLRH